MRRPCIARMVVEILRHCAPAGVAQGDAEVAVHGVDLLQGVVDQVAVVHVKNLLRWHDAGVKLVDHGIEPLRDVLRIGDKFVIRTWNGIVAAVRHGDGDRTAH